MVFTGVDGDLKFKNGSRLDLFHGSNNSVQDFMQIFNTTWRLFISPRNIFVVVTLNNIYYYKNEDESPFIKVEPICTATCIGPDFEDLNENPNEPFTFCCGTEILHKFSNYSDLLKPELDRLIKHYEVKRHSILNKL